MSLARHIPNALTSSRFFIAAFLIADALDGAASRLFVPLFLLAGLSDALDGLAARALKAESLRGCVLDGYADIALYAGAAVCACLLYPAVIKGHMYWLVGLLFLQFASWGFSLVKFRRMTSYHTYSAKAWAIMLFASLALLFAFGSTLLLVPMFVVGIISNIEEILITHVMPYWKGDIASLRDARRLRDARHLLAARRPAHL